ncbi:hypothetical protein KJ059_13440 [Myxococcota bacterium]|nr:hypothetical protein [Myxococcota bacterium]MCZ7616898.1 hypothetical protein [Myxococcota bacterium]
MKSSVRFGWMLLGSCALALWAGTAAAQTADIRVQQAIPFAPGSGATQAVIDRCELQTRLPSYLREASSRIELVDGPVGARGRVLDLKISSVRAPGGGVFSGRKWLTVTGSLRANGREIGSFTASRHSVGGAAGVFIGNCGILNRAARVLAQDIATWLEAPTKGARLGDA